MGISQEPKVTHCYSENDPMKSYMESRAPRGAMFLAATAGAFLISAAVAIVAQGMGTPNTLPEPLVPQPSEMGEEGLTTGVFEVPDGLNR